MGKMRILMAGVALALVCASGTMAAADAPEITETVMTMRVKGDITFDTRGAVTAHSLQTPVDPKIAAFVDNAIAHWRFKPFMQDGRPVGVHAPMQVTLVAKTLPGDRYDLSIENVLFHEDRFWKEGHPDPDRNGAYLKSMSRTAYPAGLASGRIGGEVLVQLLYDRSGKVVDAVIVQSALFDVKGNGRLLAQARHLFEREALRVARTASIGDGRFDDPAVRAGYGSGGLPFVFGPWGKNQDNLGQWRLEQRGPRHRAPWLMPEHGRRLAGVSDVDGTTSVANFDNGRYELLEGAPAAL